MRTLFKMLHAVILLALQGPVIQRYAASAISAGNEIYLVGGSQTESHKQEKQLDVLNPKTNRWRLGEPLSVSRDFAATASTGRLIMFAGGLDEGMKTTNRVDFYDLVDQKWVNAGQMPVAVSRASADMWGLECVFTGGIEMHGVNHVNSTAVQMYNRRLSSWTRGPEMPVGAHAHTTTAIGDTLYVVGGVKGPRSEFSADILALKGAGWKKVGSLPTPRIFHGTVAYQGSLYIFGNRGGEPHPVKFDPKTGKATELGCPDIDSHRFAYARHESKVYFFGGEGPDKEKIFDLKALKWLK